MFHVYRLFGHINCPKGTFKYYVTFSDFKNLVAFGHKQLWRPPAAKMGSSYRAHMVLIRKVRFSAFQRTPSELRSFIRSHFIVKKNILKNRFLLFFWPKK